MEAVISPDGSYITVPLSDGDCRFHAVWLRDNARDPQTVSPDNGQRLITLLDQPQDIRLASASLTIDHCLRVSFQNDLQEYEYPLAWLSQNRYDVVHHRSSGWINDNIQIWDQSLQHNIPVAEYEQALNDSQTLQQWLDAIRRYGFATMKGLPADPDCLPEVVELFGFVRETNYGRTFDVRSEINPVNLAYTGQGLQAHTDNPYRDPIPTLQLLYCIENSASGGDSIVVDGFNAASILKQEEPDYFELLSRHCARFRYAGSHEVDLSSRRPMIELNADGELIAIRFNNRSAAPFTDIPFAQMQSYYQAYRYFSEILERSENRVSFKLEAGELFIVDNTRVLHSRTAFSSHGTRWLRGCYADRDGLLSTLAALNSRC